MMRIFVFFTHFYFICEADRKKETNREYSHPLTHYPNAWGWARLTSGAWNSIQAPSHPHEWQGPNHLNPHVPTPRIFIRRKLELGTELGLKSRLLSMAYEYPNQCSTTRSDTCCVFLLCLVCHGSVLSVPLRLSYSTVSRILCRFGVKLDRHSPRTLRVCLFSSFNLKVTSIQRYFLTTLWSHSLYSSEYIAMFASMLLSIPFFFSSRLIQNLRKQLIGYWLCYA